MAVELTVGEISSVTWTPHPGQQGKMHIAGFVAFIPQVLPKNRVMQGVVGCCSVVQRVAACCSVLQRVLQCIAFMPRDRLP